MCNSAQLEEFNFLIQEFSASIDKTFVLAGHWALGYHSMEFEHFPDVSWFPKSFSCVGRAPDRFWKLK